MEARTLRVLRAGEHVKVDAVGSNALRQKWQVAPIDAGTPLARLRDFAHFGVGLSIAGGLQIEGRSWIWGACSAGYDVVVGKGAGIAPGTALTVGH